MPRINKSYLNEVVDTEVSITVLGFIYKVFLTITFPHISLTGASQPQLLNVKKSLSRRR